jgi:hypothetical protein
LPEAEGYLLKHVTRPPPPAKKRDTAGLFSARRRWRKQFFAIKANKLFFFPSHHDLSPLGFIPIGSIAAVGRTTASSRSSSGRAEEEEDQALHECAIRIRVAGPTDDAAAAVVVHLLADTPADADRWIRLLRSWRQFFALESFADDRPTGLYIDKDDDDGEDVGGSDGLVGVDPLSFVQAGPRLLAARAARAAAEASAPKSEDADKCDQGEKESEKEEMKRTKTKREEEEAEATEHQPGGAQRPPPRLKPLSWRSTAGTSVVEGSAAVTSPRGSPRVGGGAEGGGGLGSSQSETRAGRESPRSGASGWLSPRRLAEALSFRSLSPGGSGSNLRRAESARTERD